MLKYKAVYNKGLTAYLGDEYSYCYAAARRLTGGELKAYPTMSDAIAAVGKACEFAVTPIENNVEGAVNEVYDALFDSGLYILRQLVLPIRHSLIAEKGMTVDGIERIMSHPQAIGQCRKFLSGLNVPVIAAASTSAALCAATGTTAAIAFRPHDGQTVLERGIQDSALNATRFALLGAECADKGGSASIAFDLIDRPGALANVLNAINARGVNLTRILSRPHRSGSGKYRFFADFDVAGDTAALLSDIKAHCAAFRFLGRYDCERAELNQ